MKKVRLSDRDLQELKSVFEKHFLAVDRLWLFGSRADLKKKGGDIDLYVETYAESTEEAIRMRSNFLWDLEQKIGEQKIDVVLNILKYPYRLPIYEVALSEGVRIA